VRSADYMLITEGLVKRFGGLVAVNHVSLKVRRGSLTLLIGPNGSGKTTFINTCTGVLKPDAGRVIFDGKDVTGWPSHKVCKLGFVRTFQIPLPFHTLNVLENVLAAMRSPGESSLKALFKRTWLKKEEEAIERAFGILDMVGLMDYWDRPAGELSSAHTKLLEVARALAANARMIAMDEPIGGVDPAFADELLTKMKELKDKHGITLLVVEHRIDIVLPYADHVYAMDRGRLIASGKPEEVVNDPRVVEIYIG